MTRDEATTIVMQMTTAEMGVIMRVAVNICKRHALNYYESRTIYGRFESEVIADCVKANMDESRAKTLCNAFTVLNEKEDFDE